MLCCNDLHMYTRVHRMRWYARSGLQLTKSLDMMSNLNSSIRARITVTRPCPQAMCSAFTPPYRLRQEAWWIWTHTDACMLCTYVHTEKYAALCTSKHVCTNVWNALHTSCTVVHMHCTHTDRTDICPCVNVNKHTHRCTDVQTHRRTLIHAHARTHACTHTHMYNANYSAPLSQHSCHICVWWPIPAVAQHAHTGQQPRQLSSHSTHTLSKQ